MASTRLLLLASLAALATGCVHARVPTLEGEGPVSTGEGPPVVLVGDPVGLQVAARAERFVDRDSGLVRRDCSGLVETVYGELGLRLPVAEVEGNAVLREYTGMRREGELLVDRALPGDLAFFNDTYDRNHNGRIDDPLTHVAIVTEVDTDGTLTLVHFGSHGVATFKMNLAELHLARDPRGRRINDRLRVQKRRDPPQTHYLASELFVAFGRPPQAPGALARR